MLIDLCPDHIRDDEPPLASILPQSPLAITPSRRAGHIFPSVPKLCNTPRTIIQRPIRYVSPPNFILPRRPTKTKTMPTGDAWLH